MQDAILTDQHFVEIRADNLGVSKTRLPCVSAARATQQHDLLGSAGVEAGVRQVAAFKNTSADIGLAIGCAQRVK